MPFALPSASLALRGLGMLCLVVLAAGAATGADAIERRLPPKAPPIADLVAKLDDAQRLAWERVPERLEAVQQRIALARFPDDGQRAEIEVFPKAVAYALECGEWWEAQHLERATWALDEADRRLDELAAGRTGWREGGFVPLAYRSRIDGTVIEANAFRGKVLLVQLWATWCPFCRKQNPLLDKLWRSRRSDGLELLGLSIDEKPDVIKRYVAEHDYRFPVARLDAAWWAAIGRPKGLPILWVIDRESRLKQIEIGEMFPEDIELLERWI